MRVADLLPPKLWPGYRRAAQRTRAGLDGLSRRLDRRHLSEAALREILAELGMRPGALVLVHSSMDELVRRVPSLTAPAALRLFLDMLGPEGTLMMPAFPFTGSQREYMETAGIFDPRRTPSRVGLLTELFRRGRDVQRSLHPTHSVAARGPLAEELLAEHHRDGAFGENSPFVAMRKHGGLVLSVGAHPDQCFTHFHVPEELHPPTRARQFEATARPLRVLGPEGEFVYPIHVHRDDLRRDYRCAARLFKREGILRWERHRGLLFGAAEAGAFIDRGLQLLEENRYYA